MAVNRLSFSELRGLSSDEQTRRLSEFAVARSQPLNGEVEFLAERISEFETRYEMSSAVMRERLARGEIHETADIGKWLMLLDAQGSLGDATAS